MTKSNIANFTSQLKMLGYSFDWDRAVDTTDPAYYKWTQWIFLQMYKHGLAYKTTMPVNWCTSCKCVLANEEVVNGVCERCGSEVVRKEKSQWMLAHHEVRPAPDRRSGRCGLHRARQDAAAQLDRPLHRRGGRLSRPTSATSITVYTTRADTLFGATYMVISPEHPLLKQWQPTASTTATQVEAYQEAGCAQVRL